MTRPRIEIETFGHLPDGTAVERAVMHGRDGFRVGVLSLGAIVQSLQVPDLKGALADVALGFDRLEDYLADTAYVGASVGRYANRIAQGRFTLDGRTYTLPRNNGPNTLHGGPDGFSHRVWTVAGVGETAAGVELFLRLTSPDGDQGFPGEVSAEARFRVEGRSLSIRYKATTTAPTPLSLTHHGYFNLAGEGAPTALDHRLTLTAQRYLQVDLDLIPQGAPAAVSATPFDFTRPKLLGDQIDAEDLQLQRGAGYDHCFVLGETVETPRPAAELVHPASGRRMRISTTEPGLQLYTANFLDGTLTGKSGRPYLRRGAVCLETQQFPDGPNRADSPRAILRPGEVRRAETRFDFDLAS